MDIKNNKILLIFSGIILFVIIFVVTQRNGLIRSEMVIEAQWAEIENQLMRRSELMVGLLQSTRGLMAHETNIINNITESRARLAGSGSAEELIEASNQLERAFSQFLVVVENYPDIKADAAFIRLMDEIAGTENRLAAARRNYNNSVSSFNIKLRVFPSSMFANSMGMIPKPFFEIPQEARERPDYDFSF